MANTVRLTFVGDPAPAVGAFDEVGSAADDMSSHVDTASDSYGRAGEAADGAEQKARGFSDTLAGSADVASGFGAIMHGDVFGGLVTVGTGIADVAGGFNDFLLPALAKTRVGVLAKAAADRVAAAGARAWAIGQNLLNLSLLANPITWIIVGIVALIAVIVLIATKTSWFRDAWQAAWRGIRIAAQAVWTWIKGLPKDLSTVWVTITDFITAPFELAWTLVSKGAATLWTWLAGLPKKLGTAFKAVYGFVTAPFRAAFNMISDMWNKTIGKIQIKFPKFLGGGEMHMPTLPRLHAGGIVPGVAGVPTPILALGGERVSPTTSADTGTARVVVGSDGTRLGDLLVDVLAAAMRGRGGDPAALGLRIDRAATAGV
jgi:phage-related protein